MLLPRPPYYITLQNRVLHIKKKTLGVRSTAWKLRKIIFLRILQFT